MKKYVVIYKGRVIGVFYVQACAEIYASGLEGACVQLVDVL